MTHWVDRYVGIPHAQLDCSELVERVLREHYGRDVHFPRRQSDDLARRSAQIIENIPGFVVPLDQPADGCGVLMFARGRRAHMGLCVQVDTALHVLHSDQAWGESILSPLSRLPGWYRIEGYYSWL